MQPLAAPTPPPTPGSDPRKLLEDAQGYLRIVRKGWPWILVGVLLTTTAATYKLARSKTEYSAVARLLIIQQGGRPVSVGGGGDPFQSIQGPAESLATQLMLIKSPVVVERAVALAGMKSLSVPGVISGMSVRLPHSAARIVEVGYRAETPDEATKVLDGVIKSYDRFLRDNFQKNTGDIIALIVRARDDLNTELKALEQQYLEYRQRNPAYSADERGRSFIARRLDQWDQAMNNALVRAMQVRSQLDLGKKLAGEGADPLALANALNQLNGLNSQGAWVTPPPAEPPLDRSTVAALSDSLADVELQRQTAEQVLAQLRAERTGSGTASGANGPPGAGSEAAEQARLFYAEPDAAALATRVRGLKDKLKANRRLARSGSDPSVVGVQSRIDEAQAELNRLWAARRATIAARAVRESGDEFAVEVRRAAAEVLTLRARETALRDRLAQVTARELQRVRRESEEIARRQGPDSPQLGRLREQAARLRGAAGHAPGAAPAAGRSTAMVDSLARSLESIESLRRDLQSQFERDLSAFKKTELAQLEETTLRNNLERQRTLFYSVVDQLKQAQLVSDFASVSAQTIEPPQVSAQPPNTLATLLLALAAGVGLGAASAVLVDFLEGRVHTLSQVRALLDLPMIGLVPHLPREHASAGGPLGLLSHLTPHSPLAESYKSARTNYEYLRRSRRIQLLLISSPHPGDGKSTTASNLAIALASTGRRVLLVDADLRKPTLHAVYGLPRDRGLSNALEGCEPLEGLAQPTHVRNLDLLTTGPDVPNPAELLASSRLAEVLEEVRLSYDTVVIDSSPLLAVTDPSIIAAVTDAMLLVVRIYSLRRIDVEQTTELLASRGVPVAGVIINDVTREQLGNRRGAAVYGYGYGYGYGSG